MIYIHLLHIEYNADSYLEKMGDKLIYFRKLH